MKYLIRNVVTLNDYYDVDSVIATIDAYHDLMDDGNSE